MYYNEIFISIGNNRMKYLFLLSGLNISGRTGEGVDVLAHVPVGVANLIEILRLWLDTDKIDHQRKT